MSRPGPIDRVRTRLGRRIPPAHVEGILGGYQRLGRVLLVRLPESSRPSFPEIGEAYRVELGVRTVLRHRGPIRGEFRVPEVEIIAGGSTDTEVLENGIRYRFDAARVMFSAGNHSERRRAGELVRTGEVVADLFAGIGYFAIPAALPGRAHKVYACEANPESYAALRVNLRLNHVEPRVEAFQGPNEQAPIPSSSVDRVFLGLLPSGVPWIARALPLLRHGQGWIHVHHVTGTRDGLADAGDLVRAHVDRAGSRVVDLRAREVKPYGPGRMHVVVDARVAG